MSTRGESKRASQALDDLQATIDAQLQQMEGRLAPEEKSIKARSLDFSNRIFGAAQEAFERCEAVNQEVDEQHDRAEAEHAAKRAALCACRLRLEQRLRESTAALGELRSVQEEAGQLISDLRGRILKVPGSRPNSRQRKQSSPPPPATSGPAAGSKQRLAGATRSGTAGAAYAIVAASQKRRAPVQQAQQAQQKMTASGNRGAKQAGGGSGPVRLAALGKRKTAERDVVHRAPQKAAAAADAGAAPSRHVTWDK